MQEVTRLTTEQKRIFRVHVFNVIAVIPEQNEDRLFERMAILEEWVAQQLDLAATKAIAPFIKEGAKIKRL